MRRLVSFATQSLLFTASQELTEFRSDNINQISHPARRQFGRSIHELAVRNPERMAQLTGFNLAAMRSATLIGAGHDSVVFKDGSDVIKIHHSTIRKDLPGQYQEARRRQSGYELLRRHLEPYIVPQTTQVANHPFMTGQSVVLTRQPYVPLTDETIVTTDATRIDTHGLRAVCEATPGMSVSLLDFVRRSRNLHQLEGELPDINGRGNLATSEAGRLVLIDALPSDTNQYLVLEQLCSLEAALQAA